LCGKLCGGAKHPRHQRRVLQAVPLLPSKPERDFQDKPRHNVASALLQESPGPGAQIDPYTDTLSHDACFLNDTVSGMQYGGVSRLDHDQFFSLAFGAGLRSDDIAWMESFEDLCSEHGCDMALGIRSEVFVRLVMDDLARHCRQVCGSLREMLKQQILDMTHDKASQNVHQPVFDTTHEQPALGAFQQVSDATQSQTASDTHMQCRRTCFSVAQAEPAIDKINQRPRIIEAWRAADHGTVLPCIQNHLVLDHLA